MNGRVSIVPKPARFVPADDLDADHWLGGRPALATAERQMPRVLHDGNMADECDSRPRGERTTRKNVGWIGLIALIGLAGCAAQDATDPTPSFMLATPTAAGSLPATTRPSSPSDSTRPRPAPATDRPLAASQLVNAGPRDRDRIALTFHLGSRVEPAPPIMRWLRDNEVPATVFVSGAAVERTDTDAGREVLQVVNERGDLFELGSHGYEAEDFTALSAAQIEQELRRTEAALALSAAQEPRPLFAPPAGAWNDEVLAAVGRAGYQWSILWDVDPVDWKPISDGGPTSAEIVRRVTEGVRPGSIVLLQLGGEETLRALPDLVAALRERFQLAVVSELLGLGPAD